MSVLNHLKPYAVFHYFEELCSIPHGSQNTKQLSDYCASFAKERGLTYIQDESNNIIIFKAGSAGYEESDPVIIQGHLDMVCEKESGCDIDFDKEGLRLRIDGDDIYAEGTTLGGDDGIAVAYALAILDDDTLAHPPLQVIFTVDEEIGMLGAAALDCTPITARTFLNIDSEEEGILLAGCAGGATAISHLPVKRIPGEGITYALTLSGLAGGHSGMEIINNGGNANMMLGRALYELEKEIPFHLISINGGLKDNAIPRESTAHILTAADSEEKLNAFVEKYNTIFVNEKHVSDPDLSFTCQPSQADMNPMDAESKKRIITALMHYPNAVINMSQDIEGLVQTSLNLGILITSEDEVTFTQSVRSSIATEKEALISQVTSLTEYLGGRTEVSGEYPAWEYRKDSPLRDLMVEIFKKQYGYEPQVETVHAGLECGIFSEKLQGLDCVSIGPNMKDIHTTEEKLSIESVQRVWNYVVEILKSLQ